MSQAGSVEIDISPAQVGQKISVPVTYAKAFVTNPAVMLSLNYPTPEVADLSFALNTVNGFTIYCKASISGKIWVHWLAVER